MLVVVVLKSVVMRILVMVTVVTMLKIELVMMMRKRLKVTIAN